MDKKRVKKYQGNKEYIVLSMVKKYPLYSVEKLVRELPGISRHSIQRILEKNNLSRVEERLDFSTDKNVGFWLAYFLKRLKTKIFGLLGGKQILPESLKKLFFGRAKSVLKYQSVSVKALWLVLLLMLAVAINQVLAKTPEITLNQPEPNFVNQGERLLVSGKVVPKRSQVTINRNEVALNGDGSFTAVISIPPGESGIEVQALNMGKRSQVVRLVKRALTEEELQAKETEEVKKKREASDHAAEIERVVNDLLAAKNAAAGKEGGLRILNNRIKEDSGFYSVVGEVVNLTKKDASWVLITANFYNQAGGVIDTKYGFATDFGQVIQASERAKFETQATSKEFDHYNLSLSWEEGSVAGASITSTPPETITPGVTETRQ